MGIVGTIVVLVVALLVAVALFKSIHLIGPAQVGLVNKRFALEKLPEDNPIAFRGEAGYQAEMLMPGLRLKLWPVFAVQKYPWVQVTAGEIGVVIAQIGEPLPIGAKSGVYQPEFGSFSQLGQFIGLSGQKGVQRPVLPLGTLTPIHPVAFLVLTPNAVHGLPISPDLVTSTRTSGGVLSPGSFGLAPEQPRVVVISPQGPVDVIGIVTALEGEPLPSGDIASRLGGYADVAEMEAQAVSPGHRGIWREPLRTGKYRINPRCYAAEIVPTSILTLNWSKEISASHNLDANLAPIEGKSREGFVFSIELQVQIHVHDTKAPKVISMVGTMLNLVNEVLQSAVGNHFRNPLQDQPAVTFIETRMEVQEAALVRVTGYPQLYEVETEGVYIQNVHFPAELVEVLAKREIANREKAKGTADMQGALANALVNVEIQRNQADVREAEGQGEAAYVEITGRAEATKVQAIGLANAKATEALGVARDRLRGPEAGARWGGDRGRRRGERRRRRAHHRRPRGARDWRGWEQPRRPRREPDAVPRCRRERTRYRRVEGGFAGSHDRRRRRVRSRGRARQPIADLTRLS